MRHEQERAGPVVEQVLHHGEHVGVEVVAGLVEDEHVGLVEQHAHEREPPRLAAGEVADGRVELALVEAQALEELLGRVLLAADDVAPLIAAQELAHAPVELVGEQVDVLRQDAELDRLADLDVPARGGLLAVEQAQERRLAGAVLAEDAIAVARTYEPVDVVDGGAAPEGNRGLLELEDLLAEAAHGKALELERVSEGRHVGNHGPCRIDAELRLARARLGPAREPGELLSQHVLAVFLNDGGLAIALDSLLDVGRVAPLERVDRAVVDLPHALAHLVEKPPVVCDAEQRPLARGPAVAQVAREPGDGSHVEVVGGLVEQKHVPRADEQAREVDTAALTARERAHLGVPVHVADELGDDAARLGVGGPLVLWHVAHDLVCHGLIVVKLIGLAEHAHGDAAAPGDGTVVGLEPVVDELQQRRLAVAVLAHDADAVALIHADCDVSEHALARPLLREALAAD